MSLTCATCFASMRDAVTIVVNGKMLTLALFMKRIINFHQMIRCKEVLLRKDWRIINLLRDAGLQEDGPGSFYKEKFYIEGV